MDPFKTIADGHRFKLRAILKRLAANDLELVTGGHACDRGIFPEGDSVNVCHRLADKRAVEISLGNRVGNNDISVLSVVFAEDTACSVGIGI